MIVLIDNHEKSHLIKIELTIFILFIFSNKKFISLSKKVESFKLFGPPVEKMQRYGKEMFPTLIVI